jgi:hypothetical protein
MIVIAILAGLIGGGFGFVVGFGLCFWLHMPLRRAEEHVP